MWRLIAWKANTLIGKKKSDCGHCGGRKTVSAVTYHEIKYAKSYTHWTAFPAGWKVYLSNVLLGDLLALDGRDAVPKAFHHRREDSHQGGYLGDTLLGRRGQVFIKSWLTSHQQTQVLG